MHGPSALSARNEMLREVRVHLLHAHVLGGEVDRVCKWSW